MIIGGLRARLVHDSVRGHVADALATLGWLDPNRDHLPITLIDKPNHWDVPVAPNTVAIDLTGSEAYESELGSRLTSDLKAAYIEIFAQDDALGTHLANDLRDWLRGRLSATPVGVNWPIYDYRHATPPVVGYMDIHDVAAGRNVTVTDEIWMRHWYRVRFEITDTYSTSEADL